MNHFKRKALLVATIQYTDRSIVAQATVSMSSGIHGILRSIALNISKWFIASEAT